MKFRIVCILGVISVFFTTTGFVCATRVEKMEADIEALQLQFHEIQKRVNNEQTQLTEMIVRADKKLEALGDSQDETHDRVSQQNVQLALELEQERNELAAMRGRIDVQQKTITDLQSIVQTMMGSMSSSAEGNHVILPSEQEGLYQFIEEKKAAGDTSSQKIAMEEYVNRYPSDARLEKMLFELAQMASTAGEDREAIAYTTKYLQSFPKGESRNEIIYIMGDSGLKIGNCELAKKSFQTLEALKYRDAADRFKRAKAQCK